MAALGDKIRTAMEQLADANHVPLKVERSGAGYRFGISLATCSVITVADPDRGLELRFKVLADRPRDELDYTVDTDLYNILQTEHLEYAREIEAEIAEFLAALRTGRVLVGSIKSRRALLVPDGEGWTRVERGRFLVGTRHFADFAAASAGGSFAPINY